MIGGRFPRRLLAERYDEHAVEVALPLGADGVTGGDLLECTPWYNRERGKRLLSAIGSGARRVWKEPGG